MATIKLKATPWNRQQVAWIAFGVLTVGFVVALILSLRTPPQMGPDDEVFNTVDALFTAVTARDEKHLAACKARLVTYREAGKLPKPSAEYLDDVIAKAHNGGWETAAKWLYDFMLAQRRDGYDGTHDKKPKSPKGHKK